MAYVQNFLHDVFISYAHNDNLPDANSKCWVAEFKSQLENAIKQRLEGDSDKLDILRAVKSAENKSAIIPKF